MRCMAGAGGILRLLILEFSMTCITVAPGLPDILAPGLQVVFCGLNPGVDAAAAGHHFLGRGNRFWPVLHLAGFTPHLVAPRDDASVLGFGLGLTAAVGRPTSRADQVGADEFAQAAAGLLHKLACAQPQWIAFLGKAAYAAMTGKRQLAWGEQPERFGGARVWILPNPSGLNRGYSKERLVEAYAELRRALN
jgi:TDG/mug DNA glycosylase family protein